MRRVVRGAVCSVAVAVAVASCGGGGGSFQSPITPTPTPTPTVTSVIVTAPATTAKTGDASQFTATAALSNSTTETITNQASWQSTNIALATVSTSGVVTAIAPGEVDIRATYQGMQGAAHVTITAPPQSGFSICGTVKEQGSSTTLSGATIIVKDTSFLTTSDASGKYCIAGIGAGRFTLRATRSGYGLTEVDVTLNANVTVDISMPRASTPSPTPTPIPSPTPTPTPTPTPGPNGAICAASSIPVDATCIGSGNPPVTAVCGDGAYSCSQNRSGTCSSHGGVKCWVCPGTLCNALTEVALDYTPVPVESRER